LSRPALSICGQSHLEEGIMSKSNLLNFEREADEIASQLSTLNQPVVTLFRQLFLNVYYLSDSGKGREAGDLCSRLSYLPFLLSKRKKSNKAERHGAEFIFEWMDLLQYLHFCELMPQVYKNYFDVFENENTFRLAHRTEALAIYEIQDIILAELSRPFLRGKPLVLRDEMSRFFRSKPTKFPQHLIEGFINFYRGRLWDSFDISDSVYQEIVGSTLQEFNDFRVFMFAFAEFFQSIRIVMRGEPLNLHHQKIEQMMNQVSFLDFPGDNLLDQISKYTSLEKEKISNMISLFTIDFRSEGLDDISLHCGDGYLPPIIKADNTYFFSPIAVQLFLSSRNLLYAFQRKEPQKFDRVVSEQFEPHLIANICQDLQKIQNLEIRTNCHWSSTSINGEIDVLVYDSTSNKALLIQVKAVIPPQGARMVRNVQSRVLEAVDQVVRFRRLPDNEKERIISNALGYQVSNVNVVDVVLTSSCLGSVEAWLRLDNENICGTNYPLFKILVNETVNANNNESLFDISRWTKNKIDELLRISKIRWEDKEFELFGKTIQFPAWVMDEVPLQRVRKQLIDY
jgi:hypothetical protein